MLTNDEKSSILLGITRDSIIEICDDLNINVEVHSFTLEDLLCADEIFFTGTASEVTPVRSVEDNVISNGNPGDITLKLRKCYMDIVNGKNNKYRKWLSPVVSSSVIENP